MKIKNFVALALVFAVLFSFCACRKLDGNIEIEGGSDDIGDNSDVETTLSKEMQEFIDSITDPNNEDKYYVKNDAVLSISDEPIDDSKLVEVEVKTDEEGKPIHGESQTLFEKLEQSDRYTMRMTIKNETAEGESTTVDVTMMKDGDNSYIETKLPVSDGSVLPASILVKDGKCVIYMSSLRAYMNVPQETYEEMTNEMKLATTQESTAEYIKSYTYDINGTTYAVDEYLDDSQIVRYMFLNDEIKRIEISDEEGNKTIMEYTEMSDTVDQSKFTVPKGYMDMTALMNSSEFGGILG